MPSSRRNSKQKEEPPNGLGEIPPGLLNFPALTPPILPQSNLMNQLFGPKTTPTLRGKVFRNSLVALEQNSGLFPDLTASSEILSSCLSEVEALLEGGPPPLVDRRYRAIYPGVSNGSQGSRRGSEYLILELLALSESLGKLMRSLPGPPLASDAVMGLIMSIDYEIREIITATRLSPSLHRNTATGYKILQHFQSIGSLFKKLRGNLDTNKHNNAFKDFKLPDSDVSFGRLHLSTLANHSIQGLINIKWPVCAPGTRTRVLAKLDEWINNSKSSSVLYVSGSAGTGKTTIAYTFCEEMRKRKLLAASFFCTRTPVPRIDHRVYQIIPAIAHQLADYSIPFRSAISNVSQNDQEAWSPMYGLRDQFERLLKKPLQDAGGTLPDSSVVAIDALDEWEAGEAETLLRLLFEYAPKMKLKFLVVSRPMTHARGFLRTPYRDTDFMNLDDDSDKDLRADIELYLARELEHLGSSETDRSRLMECFGVSFSYATKLVSYVKSPEELSSQQKRLMSLIDTTPGSPDWYPVIDPLYLDILNDAAVDADNAKEIRTILQAVLLAHEPINVETIGMLGGMLGEISNSKRLTKILHRLYVLDYSKQTGLTATSTSYPGFLEFTSSKERAGPYSFTPAQQNQVLAQRCFLHMKKRLGFNICQLKSSFLLDEEVKDIDSQIQKNISPTLAYACRYWANYLTLADNIDDITLTMLSEFLSCELLFWMEVLNLQKELNIGVLALLKTKNVLEGMTSPPQLTNLLNEAYIFVRDFADSPVSRSTPHIYMSSLQLCPSSSALYQAYARRICGWLQPPESATKYRDVLHPTFQSWKIGSGVLSAAYSPDGSRVALGCEDGTVNICDAHTGLLLVEPLDAHSDWVRCVVFSPDGAYILSASSDCTIRKWDAVAGVSLPASFQGHTHPVKSIAFSPDGTRVVSGSWDNTVRIWNAQDGKPVSEPLEGHKWGVNCVAFSPNNASIASGANDHTIRLWEPGNNIHRVQLLEGHTNAVTSIVFTPDGSRLISGSVDCSICVWDMKDGTLTTRFLQSCIHMVYSVAISPDGRLVASGSSDSTVKVWDIDTGNAMFGPMGHASGVRTVTFSQDGTRLFSGSHESARSWNLRPVLEAPNFNTLPGSQHIGSPSTTQVLDTVGGSSEVSKGPFASLSALRPEKPAPRSPLSMTSLRWLLERSQLAYIPKDAIAPIHTVSTLEPNRILMSLPEGWERKSEGWLVNHRSRLLVWLPESYGSCQLHSDADRQSRLIFWWLRYQELVGDQWPGGSGCLTKVTDKSSSK